MVSRNPPEHDMDSIQRREPILPGTNVLGMLGLIDKTNQRVKASPNREIKQDRIRRMHQDIGVAIFRYVLPHETLVSRRKRLDPLSIGNKLVHLWIAQWRLCHSDIELRKVILHEGGDW